MATSLVFAGELPASTLSQRTAAGTLVRLAPGVYTTDTMDPEGVAAREWRAIVGHLMPTGVITDRSAPTGGPVAGILYLARPIRTRELRLPGLSVLVRQGPGALSDDIAVPGGLHQASRARGLVENTRPSRASGRGPARTLTDTELGDWVERLVRIDGEAALISYRQRSEHIADKLGIAPQGVARLGALIGVALGTKLGSAGASSALAARLAGAPYDSDRVATLDLLAEALRDSLPQNCPAEPVEPRWRHLPFFEAYFSNYIEGTEFELAEAARVIYEGSVPSGRPADAHDLVGTYQLVSDPGEMMSLASSADQLLDVLRYRHSVVLGGRPDKHPGQFKTRTNRAGDTDFVAPQLVEGTLRAGFDRLSVLDTGWERAVYMMFLISEVHPFDDGNGRVARIMMNAELVASRQARIIVPTVFRDDYLGALRRLSRQDDPSILIKALRYAHDYTASVDYTDFASAAEALARTNAFEHPDSPRRLVLDRSSSLARPQRPRPSTVVHPQVQDGR